MIVNNDVKVIHIKYLRAQIPQYSLNDRKDINQIMEIINGASREPRVFMTNIELTMDNKPDKIFISGPYFKFQRLTYRADLDLEKLLIFMDSKQ